MWMPSVLKCFVKAFCSLCELARVLRDFMLFTGADIYTSGEQEMWQSCWESNQQLLTSLRADANEDGLHELALDDWEKSRLSEPSPASACDLGQVRCVPRFGVEQGVKADGSMKLRAVDHFSWSHCADVGNHGRKRKRTKKAVKASSVNGHYDMSCNVAHDHLDALLASLRMHKDLIGEVPGLWKSDIDSAFRRAPVKPEHSSATGIAYLHRGVPLIAQHCGMPPFGATARVVAWHRIGELLAILARVLLHLPVYRYVDDYLACERLSHFDLGSLASFLVLDCCQARSHGA